MKKIFAIMLVISFLVAGNAFAQDATATATNDATATAGSSADSQNVNGQKQATELDILNNSFNSRGMRGFAIPGEVTYGPLINSYSKPLPSEGFQPVEELIMYSCWFTDGSLESLLRGVEDAEAEFKVANLRIADANPAAEDGTTKWIKVIISKDKYEGKNVGFKGFITARSDDRRTTMTEVMAKAALVAVQNGCNVIHFTAQGAVRDTESFGWGIGFNTTQAQIASGQNHSNVTSGGFGISKGTAGTRDKPWLQGFGLVDADLVYPVLDLPSEQVDTNNSVLKPAPKTTAGNQFNAEVPQTSVRINPDS